MVNSRKKSETCTCKCIEVNNLPLISHSSTGVPFTYLGILMFRKKIFEYDWRAFKIGDDSFRFFGCPTGVTNNTNIFRSGFWIAADSIAQACLFSKNGFNVKMPVIFFPSMKINYNKLPRIQVDQTVFGARCFEEKNTGAVCWLYFRFRNVFQKIYGLCSIFRKLITFEFFKCEFLCQWWT